MSPQRSDLRTYLIATSIFNACDSHNATVRVQCHHQLREGAQVRHRSATQRLCICIPLRIVCKTLYQYAM